MYSTATLTAAWNVEFYFPYVSWEQSGGKFLLSGTTAYMIMCPWISDFNAFLINININTGTVVWRKKWAMEYADAGDMMTTANTNLYINGGNLYIAF